MPLSEGDALRRFANAMAEAADASRQLAYLQQRPHWLAVQNAVLGAREYAMKLASSTKLVLPPSIARMQ